MDRVWHPALFLAIALMLGACAGSVVTSQGRAHRPGMPEAFNYAAARGEMPTVVIGDPFSPEFTQQSVFVSVVLSYALDEFPNAPIEQDVLCHPVGGQGDPAGGISQGLGLDACSVLRRHAVELLRP